jgi:hypothetical protein
MFGDPRMNMALARRLAAGALAIKVEDLPPDADVEIAHNEAGVLFVRASVMRGSLRDVTVTGKIVVCGS